MQVTPDGNAPPNPFPCGGAGQAGCPPEPVSLLPRQPIKAGDAPRVLLYSWNEMAAHGAAQYAKGRVDALTEQTGSTTKED